MANRRGYGKKEMLFPFTIVFHSFLLIKKMEVPPKKEKKNVNGNFPNHDLN